VTLRTSSIVSNAVLFTGREYDRETGLYYYRHRYTDPQLGRFLRRDPAGYAGGVNLYEYVGGRPTGFTDPLGLLDRICRDASCNSDALERRVTKSVVQIGALSTTVLGCRGEQLGSGARLMTIRLVPQATPCTQGRIAFRRSLV
jgi:RHS repeat-associated protein